MARLKSLVYDEMTDAQKSAHDEILSGPRTRIGGPMNAWFRNPELAGLAQRLGAFCRFQTSLPPKLSELAILIVARDWSAEVEWWVHQPIAVEAGIDAAITEAIRKRERPRFENRDEEVLYDFASELMADKSVTAKTYDAALAEFGETTVVEMVAVLGYYTSVAMVLNAFDELPADGTLPLST